MQLNTTAALVTAIFSAVIGFGLAFFLERKISRNTQKKSQKILISIAMISFGYGLMATLNELIGFPLQGLRIRYDKLIGYVVANMLLVPIIFLTIAKLIGLKSKYVTTDSGFQSKKISFGDELKNEKSTAFKSRTKLDEPVLSELEKFAIKENKIKLKSTVDYQENRSKDVLMDVSMIDEEKIWEQAFNEFDGEARRKGLWAKLLVELNGDNEKAKIKYLKERFEQIKLELVSGIEQAKQKEIQAKEAERLAVIEITKKLTTEECIGKGHFELKEYKSKSYYVFPNGEASIKRNDEYRIYANENSVRHAIRVYLETELLPKDGFLRAYKEKLKEVEAQKIKSSDAHKSRSYEFEGSKDFIFDDKARSILYISAQAFIDANDESAHDVCLLVAQFMDSNEIDYFTNYIVNLVKDNEACQKRKVQLLDKMFNTNGNLSSYPKSATENKWLKYLLNKNIEAAEELYKNNYLKKSEK